MEAHHPLAPQAASLIDLPSELLLQIRSCIPLEEFETHLIFQSLCRVIRAIYLADEPFWQGLSFHYGIGRPTLPQWHYYRHPLTDASWRELALSVVGPQRRSPYRPDASGFMAEPWRGRMKSERVLDRDMLDKTDICDGFETSALFHVDGSAEMHANAFSHQSLMQYCDGMSLRDYVAASCRFATNPPLSALEVTLLGYASFEVRNNTGVTVHDVLCELPKVIFKYLQVSESFPLSEFALVHETWRAVIPALRELDILGSITLEFTVNHLQMLRDGGEVPDDVWEMLTRFREHWPAPLLAAPLLVAFQNLTTVTVADIVSCMAKVRSLEDSHWLHALEHCQTVGALFEGKVFIGLSQSLGEGPTSFMAEFRFDADD